MSDLDTVLEEIEGIQSFISAVIWRGKVLGNIEGLELVRRELDFALDKIVLDYPELT